MKVGSAILSLMTISLSVGSALAQVQSMDIATPMDPKVAQVIKDSGRPKIHVESFESFADFNKAPQANGKFSSDGPTVQVVFDIPKTHLVPLAWQDSVDLQGSVTMMMNELINVTDSKVQVPLAEHPNWNYFFREAKIIFHLHPKTQIPIATIIFGIQDLDSGAFDSAMPIRDNNPLRGLTRIRSAHAIQVQLNSKILDLLSVAAFNTGVGHPENMGENIQGHVPGFTVMMSKKLTESLRANAQVTRIAYPAQAELRINTGVAYENKAGGYTVFFDHVYMPQKGNPLFPDATSAWTLGAIKQLNPHNFVTAEVSNVNNGTYRETAIGYKHVLKDDRTSFAVGVRKTKDGPKIEGRAAYNYGPK